MCGISGIIHQNGSSVPEASILAMNEQILHRGPDDGGVHREGCFAFGHRRLAIVDISADGHQPMVYQDKYVLIYNGEIYNFEEIKAELIQQGYTFISKTDTEVVLAAYDAWGMSCVEHFNGMWAFALYDRQQQKIFCSRDRFGVKPFYYAMIDGKFLFGSEIKQLLPFFKRRVVNTSLVIDYIVTHMVEHTSETFFNDIYKLPPACHLVYDLNHHTFSISTYYEVPRLAKRVHLNEAMADYEKEFERSIGYRLRSDVMVGTCLSGGLDSTYVASVAARSYAKKSREPFIAIHAKSSESDTDESAYASSVAKTMSLDLRVIEPSSDDFKALIDEVVYTQEEPFGSPSIFMQYCVMKKAKEIGCKVMLDGQGGDETLLGYERYYPSLYIVYYRQYGLWTMCQEIYDSYRNNQKMTLLNILKYTMGAFCSSLRKKIHLNHVRFLKPHSNTFSFLDELSVCYWDTYALQMYEISHSNLPSLLRYEDKNSMRHSVEARLPFLDYRVLEYALNLNSEHKMHRGWSKWILRKILEKTFSSHIVWRKQKLGFDAPEKSWMASLHHEMLDAIQTSRILSRITHLSEVSQQFERMDHRLKWRLYNIAVWERLYSVEID